MHVLYGLLLWFQSMHQQFRAIGCMVRNQEDSLGLIMCCQAFYYYRFVSSILLTHTFEHFTNGHCRAFYSYSSFTREFTSDDQLVKQKRSRSGVAGNGEMVSLSWKYRFFFVYRNLNRRKALKRRPERRLKTQPIISKIRPMIEARVREYEVIFS